LKNITFVLHLRYL